MRAIQSGMLHISHWARNNKNKSRALIVLLRTILMTTAILSGFMLSDWGRPAGDWLLISGVLLFFTGLYYYPSVKAAVCNTNRRNRYFRQKLSGMAITSSAVLMFIYIGSQMQELPINSKSSFPFIKQVNGAVARKSSLNKIDHSITLSPKKTKKQGFFAKWKEVKKLLKASRPNKNMAGRSEPLTGGQFLGSLLLILLGVLAIALLGALSCSMACEGNEAGAVIILLIGLPAIIFLVVRGIRKITNQQPKKKSKEATQ